MTSWQKYKTKPAEADITILGKKFLLQILRKIINTSKKENTHLQITFIQTLESPLALKFVLLVFRHIHSPNTKGIIGSEKSMTIFLKNFTY